MAEAVFVLGNKWTWWGLWVLIQKQHRPGSHPAMAYCFVKKAGLDESTSKLHQGANTVHSQSHWTWKTQFNRTQKTFPCKGQSRLFCVRPMLLHLPTSALRGGKVARASGSLWRRGRLPLCHHIHSVRARWLSFSGAQECGRSSLALGCLRETDPPSPKKLRKPSFHPIS